MTAYVKEIVLKEVVDSNKKLTPRELERILLRKLPIEITEIKSVIKDLIENGDLCYTYKYGCSFLEQSFNKPVRISTRVVLKPPGIFYKGEKEDVVIQIQQGASFGIGQHPTTRLALRGIEYLLLNYLFFKENKNTSALDIGTGTGVLSIASVLLGINRAVGIDIDPCAIAEAKANVKINGLEDRIKIEDKFVENIDEKFPLITANLRYPTIKRLYSHIKRITVREGIAVISGIKTCEVNSLLNTYKEKYFKVKWKETANDWACVVLKKIF